MQRFEIGDRVTPAGGDGFPERAGKIGTVVESTFSPGSVKCLVKFDDDSLNLSQSRGFGWVYSTRDLRIVSSAAKAMEYEGMKRAEGVRELTPAQEKNLSKEAKALVRIGALDNRLVVDNVAQVLDMLVELYFNELAGIAEARIEVIEKKTKAAK